MGTRAKDIPQYAADGQSHYVPPHDEAGLAAVLEQPGLYLPQQGTVSGPPPSTSATSQASQPSSSSGDQVTDEEYRSARNFQRVNAQTTYPAFSARRAAYGTLFAAGVVGLVFLLATELGVPSDDNKWNDLVIYALSGLGMGVAARPALYGKGYDYSLNAVTMGFLLVTVSHALVNQITLDDQNPAKIAAAAALLLYSLFLYVTMVRKGASATFKSLLAPEARQHRYQHACEAALVVGLIGWGLLLWEAANGNQFDAISVWGLGALCSLMIGSSLRPVVHADATRSQNFPLYVFTPALMALSLLAVFGMQDGNALMSGCSTIGAGCLVLAHYVMMQKDPMTTVQTMLRLSKGSVQGESPEDRQRFINRASNNVAPD